MRQLTPVLGHGDLLAKILNATKEGVLIADRTSTILTVNHSAGSVFRVQPAELIGQKISALIQDETILGAFEGAILENATSDLHMKFGAFADRRYYDLRITPLELPPDRFTIAFFYDVTQIHRLENVRQEFLSNVSHELRTPLTSILAFVETLENGGLTDLENNQRFLAAIRRNGDRMRDLIADILELSQIEAGSVLLDRKDLNLFTIVSSIIADLSAQAAKRSVEITNETNKTTVVRADRKRLEQMLTNLVHNAIRFNRIGGKVTVSDTTNGDRRHIHVADSGEGIDEKEMLRIFERFYRVDRARTREIGGTGLGLAIVKHLARLHGGEVTVKSELGVGTQFTIDLPL